MSRVVAVAGETLGIEARAEAQGRSIEGGVFEGELFCLAWTCVKREGANDRCQRCQYADLAFSTPHRSPCFLRPPRLFLIVDFVVMVLIGIQIKKGPDAQLRRAQLDNLGFVWNPKRGRTKRFIEGG